MRRVEGMVDVDPRLGCDQYQLLYGAPGGPADRFVARHAGREPTNGDLATFTRVSRRTARTGPRRRRSSPTCATRRRRSRRRRASSVLVGGGAAEVRDVVDRIAADFPRSALFILISTYIVLFVLLRSGGPAGSRR